jgi:hypothetical protein
MKLKILFGSLILIILLAFSGCTSNYYEYSQHSQEIKDYGNGVYFFPVTGDNFGWWLSRFIRDNNVEVLSVARNMANSIDSTAGFFVIVKEK